MLMTAAIWGIAIAGFGLTRTLWLTLSLLAVAGAADTTSVIFRALSFRLRPRSPRPHSGRQRRPGDVRRRRADQARFPGGGEFRRARRGPGTPPPRPGDVGRRPAVPAGQTRYRRGPVRPARPPKETRLALARPAGYHDQAPAATWAQAEAAGGSVERAGGRRRQRRNTTVTLLETISGPRDVKDLSADQLSQLAAEIRDFLIQAVSRNGGHLGPTLGVVELTIALHRVFDSPVDRILFDTGHQSYVHKLLTGRRAAFDRLRQRGGISGYPSRAESEHDVVENSHASTSLSYADGLAKAYQLRGETGRCVVAVIGDGALTGGMAWEALNNIAGSKDRRVVIVVNDNGRSYQPTIGGLAEHLAKVRVSQRYEQVLDYIKTSLSRAPLVGPPLYETLHGLKKGLKDVIQPQVLFEDLGLKYLGPVDGHDEQAVEQALRRARDFGGPVLVHVITRKGFGYPLAEENDEDCLHQVPPAVSAVLGTAVAPRTWSTVFGEELLAIGARRPDVVAITAAMLHPTGLAAFSFAYPDRVFDVGIAEQHAMTSAAGMAMGGMHPVVAVYATFLNRAFDQLLLDVALHGLPVTVVLDRAASPGRTEPSTM